MTASVDQMCAVVAKKQRHREASALCELMWADPLVKTALNEDRNNYLLSIAADAQSAAEKGDAKGIFAAAKRLGKATAQSLQVVFHENGTTLMDPH